MEWKKPAPRTAAKISPADRARRRYTGGAIRPPASWRAWTPPDKGTKKFARVHASCCSCNTQIAFPFEHNPSNYNASPFEGFSPAEVRTVKTPVRIRLGGPHGMNGRFRERFAVTLLCQHSRRCNSTKGLVTGGFQPTIPPDRVRDRGDKAKRFSLRPTLSPYPCREGRTAFPPRGPPFVFPWNYRLQRHTT